MKIEIDLGQLCTWTVEAVYFGLMAGMFWVVYNALKWLYNICINSEEVRAAIEAQKAKDGHPKNRLNTDQDAGSAAGPTSSSPGPRTRSQTRMERELKREAAKKANADRKKKRNRTEELNQTPDYSVTDEDCDMALATYYEYLEAVPRQPGKEKREKMVHTAYLENIDDLDNEGIETLEAIFSQQSQLLWFPNPSGLESHWHALQEVDKESVINDYCAFAMAELVKIEDMVHMALFANDVGCISDKRFRVFSKLFARFQIGVEDVLKELEKIKKLQSRCKKFWPPRNDFLGKNTLKKARETLNKIQYLAQVKVVSDREYQTAVDKKLAEELHEEEVRQQQQQRSDPQASPSETEGPEDDLESDAGGSEFEEDEDDYIQTRHNSTLRNRERDDKHVTFSNTTANLTARQQKIEEAILNHNKTRNAGKFDQPGFIKTQSQAQPWPDQQRQQHRQQQQHVGHTPRVPQPGTVGPTRPIRTVDQSTILAGSHISDPEQSLHQRVMNKDLNVSCLFKVDNDSGSGIVQFRNRFDPTPRELELAYDNCPPPFNQQPVFAETRSTEKFFQSGFEGGFKFDGTWETFLSWQGMFIQNVHKVKALEVSKLRALMAAVETVKGPHALELKQLFQKVDHSAQCYFELIHQIVRDYGGHERMTRAAYDQLRKLGKVDSGSQTSMKNFMSILHRYTLAEESFGERGALESKQLMDVVSELLSWEDINEYSKFLSQNRDLKRGIRSFVLWGNQKMIQLDEVAFLAKGKESKKSTTSYAYHGEKSSNDKNSGQRYSHKESGPSGGASKKPNLPEKCPLCSGKFHSFLKCKEWHKMSQQDRHTALLSHNRCHSCTWAGHKSRYCTWRQRGCGICTEKTHTKYTHDPFKAMVASLKSKRSSTSANHADFEADCEGPEDGDLDDLDEVDLQDEEVVGPEEVDDEPSNE